jgi:exopolysaccharide biosynthesis WecB/TagA/CpsF family protein
MTAGQADPRSADRTRVARVRLAGVAFDPVTLEGVLGWVRQRRDRGGFAYIVTPNSDHVVRLHDHANWREMRDAYSDADLCLCDSRVLSLLASLRGIDLPVVPGSELVEALFRSEIVHRSRIAIVGGTPHSLERLRRLRNDVEFMQHLPPMGLLHNERAMDECVAFVESARADFTLLCVGSPQQELIAHRLAASSRSDGVAFCVGAALGFLTGELRRAPRWMQSLALEWLFRLVSEPRRLWRRYLCHSSRILLIVWR